MPKLITARCQTCGKETQVEWTLGAKCPACGSEKFFPVVHIHKSEGGGTARAAPAGSRMPFGLFLAIGFVLIAIALLVIRITSTTREQKYRTTATMICTNCEKMFRKELSTRNVFPKLECPDCKQKTAYRAVQCRNCEEIFALETEGKENPTLDLVCPYCGSPDIDLDSSSIPVEEEEE